MIAGEWARTGRGAPPVEHRMIVTGRWRGTGKLERPRLDPPPPDPAIAELVEIGRALPAGAALWLTGGEPTLRADLPALIAALSQCGVRVGLCSDGLALPVAGALAPLLASGLSSVRLGLHAARGDAHDWLVGRPGAARRVRKAVGSWRAAGLAVALGASSTRPTAGYLAERGAV